MMPIDGTAVGRAWRLCGTGFSFASFGLGGLALSLCWFPLLNLFVRDPLRRRIAAQGTIRKGFRLFLWMMEFLRVIDYKIENAEALQGDSGCIVVANHPTLIDVILIGSVLPRCDCIVKRRILENVFMRGVARAAGYVPNVEGPEILGRCGTILDDGGTLLIFPEGTRSVPMRPIQVKRGAANLAVRLNRDLRLVHIECEPPTLLKGQKWHEIPPRRPFFHVRVGERVAIATFLEGAPPLSIAARRLTRYLETALDPTPRPHVKEKDQDHERPRPRSEGIDHRLPEPRASHS